MSRKGKKKKSKARKTYHVRGFCRNLALAYRFLGEEDFEDCNEFDMALKEAFYAAQKEKIRTGFQFLSSNIIISSLHDSELIKRGNTNPNYLRILVRDYDAIEMLKRYSHIRRDINGFINAARVLRKFYQDPELHYEYQRHKEQYRR